MKYFLIVFYTILSLVVLNAQNFSISVNTDADTTFAMQKHDYKTVFTNLTNSPLDIRWIRIDGSSNPSGWAITTCDYIQCWLPHVVTGDNQIPANGFFEFKTTVDPQSTIGTGTSTTIFFEPSDSAGTVQTHSVTHTHLGTLNTSSTQSPITAFNIYPNPVNNSFNLEFFLLENTDITISIFNSLGQKVQNVGKKNFIGRNVLLVNTSDLSTGLYYVNAVTDQDMVSLRFVVDR
ncbi:MAG: T9SS type A sorting domain-containing protein [Saprospiraceae bacterium]|nr:T9SS type A sorting domain-containing protein [Saprospiraceae bacterium]